MANDNLRQAKAAKNDEFYTLYEDIAAELKHYSTFLRGKTVLCNCDDPQWSNFWKYLHNNFSVLGLKKLISTHYEPDGSPSYKMEYEGGDDLNTEVGTVTPLKGNGDFRSEECIELLRSSDVVITNPPFSLTVPYMNCLINSGKAFLVIGNMNASHNKDIFPLIRDNKMWYGVSIHSGDRKFNVPDSYPLNAAGCGIDPDGRKYIRVKGVRWFTNIDNKNRHQPFFPPEDAHCYYEGNEDKYPKYYNFDGIDVAKTELIPIDYTGYMGVPISFLDKYNPDDFELIGTGSDVPKTMTHTVTENKKTIAYVRPDGSVAWSTPYTVSERKLGNGLRIDNNGVPGDSPFSRIIIKNRHPIAKKDDI